MVEPDSNSTKIFAVSMASLGFPSFSFRSSISTAHVPVAYTRNGLLDPLADIILQAEQGKNTNQNSRAKRRRKKSKIESLRIQSTIQQHPCTTLPNKGYLKHSRLIKVGHSMVHTQWVSILKYIHDMRTTNSLYYYSTSTT